MLHFRGALATLALSAVGSAILPIPYAFRCTGVALGVALGTVALHTRKRAQRPGDTCLPFSSVVPCPPPSGCVMRVV